MIPTNSRIGVLLLAGIQWVRLPVACKIFPEKYGYAFQSEVQNSFYQQARQVHLGRLLVAETTVVSGKWVIFFLKYCLQCGQRQFIQKLPHYISN